MTLTKADIVASIAEQNGLPNTTSSEIVETLLEIIKKSLESGEDVLISGFGKFCVKRNKRGETRLPVSI
jgi:integration host factor subunit alpha